MPTNFVIGHLLMWFGRHQLHGTTLWTRPLKLAWAYSAFVFVPITAWFFYAYPGWSTVYLRPESTIPAWSGPLIVSHYFLGMVIGTMLAQALLRAGQIKYFWFSFGCGVYWLVMVWLLTLNEYQHLGTYIEYHSGLARPIFENAEFMTHLNVMGAIMGLPPVAIAWWLHRARKGR